MIKHALIIFTSLIVVPFVFSCSGADSAKFFSNASKHKIQLYSGGVMVREWVSTGRVQNEKNSDGYYFKDLTTGKLVCVSGDVVITIVD